MRDHRCWRPAADFADEANIHTKILLSQAESHDFATVIGLIGRGMDMG